MIEVLAYAGAIIVVFALCTHLIILMFYLYDQVTTYIKRRKKK